MATFSFKIKKKLYGLIYWKESDEIHSLKIQRIEVSVCFMGHIDEINVAFALRKPTVHHGGWYTHFIKGMTNTRRGAGVVSIRCQCYGHLDLFVTCIGHLRRNLWVTWAASFYYKASLKCSYEGNKCFTKDTQLINDRAGIRNQITLLLTQWWLSWTTLLLHKMSNMNI